jgi:hypothetical protein
MQRLALVVLAACASEVATAAPPASPAPAPPATQWMGCLYARADLARDVPKLDMPPHGDFVLVLASLQRHGAALHAFVALVAIDHPPKPHESMTLTGRMDDTVRQQPGLVVNHAAVVIKDHEPDIRFASAGRLDTFFDYELHGVAVGGDPYDVTLASSQETEVFDGTKHLAIPVKRYTRLAECQFTPDVSATQRPEVEP